jgi:hypothetical protein
VPIALSTCFARPHGLGPEAIEGVLTRGSTAGVVLDQGLSAGLLEALAPRLLRGGLPILAIEAPCPWNRASTAALCAADRAEATAALDAALSTVERASTLGARFVVLSLGEIAVLARDFAHARDRFTRGELDEQHALELLDARDQATGRSLDSARRALERLCRAAESASVMLVLRSPRRYIALPSPQELDQLLADLSGAPLAAALDLPAAHLLDVMGFHPLALSLATFGARSALLYGGDACGPIGALPPGRGVLDLPRLTAGLPKDLPTAIAPWSGLTLDETQLFDAVRR